AAGHDVGKSLYEPDLIAEARRLMEQAQTNNAEIPLPTDVVTGKEFSADTRAETKPVTEIEEDDMIFDVGPDTANMLAEKLKTAGTIVWNG
ncbi:MAG TPA: phosphoglycerate kinase, partial [Idiomarina sp.]|nr:phosphoglycerate kinase [Idiomarina sp.]